LSALRNKVVIIRMFIPILPQKA